MTTTGVADGLFSGDEGLPDGFTTKIFKKTRNGPDSHSKTSRCA